MRSESDKGISRVDSVPNSGWLVRGYHAGETFSRYFSDRSEGGPEQALEAARQYRDKLHQHLSTLPQLKRKRRMRERPSANSTGVPGVFRIVRKAADGSPAVYFSVTWTPQPGVHKRRTFSARRYGEEEAFALAVAHRRAMVQAWSAPSGFESLPERSQ